MVKHRFAAFALLALFWGSIGAFAQNGVISWQAVTPQFGGDGVIGQALTSGGKGLPPTWQPFQNQLILTIATLGSCAAVNVGEREFVSNGETTITFNAAVSATGAVFAPVTCSFLTATTYGWKYA